MLPAWPEWFMDDLEMLDHSAFEPTKLIVGRTAAATADDDHATNITRLLNDRDNERYGLQAYKPSAEKSIAS